jgi:hypothetical protein
MPQNTLAKPALLMLILVVTAIGSWEIYLRNKGVAISYDDGPPLWSHNRAMVYEPSDKATVFIGSSRIKFDLDIDTWQRITGKHAIQIAQVGTSPMPVLEDLGNDPKFKGRLVVDVTEGLFFSDAPGMQRYITYNHKETPTQKASFQLNHVLESTFVFLDKDFLSLNAQLDELKIPDRPGVFQEPDFPMEFESTNFDRQDKMSPQFLADTSLQKRVQNIWLYIIGLGQHAPQPPVDPVPGIMQTAKDAIDKIRSRGGDVVFVRTPSSGRFRDIEQHAFPRAAFWNKLLAVTHCRGIYYADYPAMAHFVCPEWSHLSPHDAVLYTQALTGLLPAPFARQ